MLLPGSSSVNGRGVFVHISTIVHKLDFAKSGAALRTTMPRTPHEHWRCGCETTRRPEKCGLSEGTAHAPANFGAETVIDNTNTPSVVFAVIVFSVESRRLFQHGGRFRCACLLWTTTRLRAGQWSTC